MKNTLSWLILLGLVLVWGSSFILIKRSLLYFSSDEVGILRIVITFLFLSPIAFIRFKKIERKTAIILFVSGIIGSVIPSWLFATAQTQIDSSLAGTLNSLTPLFTLIVGLLFFKLKTRWYNIIGVIIGLFGAVGLIMASSSGSFDLNIKYSFLVIIATLCYAINVNIIKTYLNHLDSLSITALTFFLVGLPLLFFTIFFMDVPAEIIAEPEKLKGLGYLSVLSIVGTGLALIAFNNLIKISSPVFASSVTYLIPVVAIAWGILDGEIFKLSYILWFALIIFGVFMVNAKPGKGANISSMLLFGKRAK
ncbi:MAG: DMT family transporter [Chlorobi bacterium]|nr:DMT family transporter [Chlorobiota bacterium]